MAHMLDMSGGRANMAYVGETPWHGLGEQLPEGEGMEVWAKAAGMDWRIEPEPLTYTTPGGVVIVPDKKALYRGDTFGHLAIVGKEFKVVQPREVLEFFRSLTEEKGFELETAGCLFGGRRFWAMARTGREMRLKGVDKVEGYLLLATACDGTLATTAQFTSVRVVCQNTLRMSIQNDDKGSIKVRHKSEFKPEEVKRELGIEVWEKFEEQADRLVNTEFDRRDKATMRAFLVEVFQGDMDKELEQQPNKRAMMATFEQLVNSPGCDMPSARNTAWGALNAVTRYVDFVRPVRGENGKDNRFAGGQWGQGAEIKQRAMDWLVKMAA